MEGKETDFSLSQVNMYSSYFRKVAKAFMHLCQVTISSHLSFRGFQWQVLLACSVSMHTVYKKNISCEKLMICLMEHLLTSIASYVVNGNDFSSSLSPGTLIALASSSLSLVRWIQSADVLCNIKEEKLWKGIRRNKFFVKNLLSSGPLLQ